MTEGDATDRAKGRSQQLAFLSTPLRINEIVLLASLGCYVAGFAITNLYIGSMGVASLEILRTRYVLAGLLFFLFLGLVLFPLREARRILDRSIEKSVFLIANSLFWHTAQVYSISYLAVGAVGVLAGSVAAPPLGIPQFPADLPWDAWRDVFPTLLRVSLQAIGVLLLIAAGLTILLFLVGLIIRPKSPEGSRPSRREFAKEFVNADMLTGFLKLAARLVLFALGSAFAISILYILSLGALASITAFPLTVRLSPPDWVFRFMATAMAFYLLGVIYNLMIWRREPSHDRLDRDELVKIRVLAFTFEAALVLGVIVPVYTLAVYPRRPSVSSCSSALSKRVAAELLSVW